MTAVKAEPPAPLLDAELRQFVGRLMTGYESAHRRVADLCDMLAGRLEQAEGVTARALEMQVRLAGEREDLISRRHQRELESEAAQHRQETMTEITRDVRALLPLVGKRLLGAPLTGADGHGMQDLLGTLTPDQIDAIMTTGTLTLSMGQRQLLGAVFQSLAGEKAGDAE